ncbi:nuclear transport factor 2 family protein [Taklimakanibacter deserti]|uniref:nuclear transport factor 2 family protein n=1 Tax=Taklimakanibacter deserti TaxID=2267839 RepID=UPI000E651636
MSAANIAFVKSLYAAFGRGDIKTVIAGLAPDVDWFVNGRHKDYPILGSWKGQASVQQLFASVAEQQETIEFSPMEFFAADDRVCVLGHYAWKIRKTGRSVAADWAHIFTIGSGKVVKFREFTDTAQFAEAYR